MTPIEQDCWWSWNHLRNRMQRIWYRYIQYGETILEKELGEDTNKYKEMFVSSEHDTEFLSKIRKYWETHFHFVANNYNELMNLFEIYKTVPCNKFNSFTLAPEAKNYLFNNDINGNNETFAIAKELYEHILGDMDENKELYLMNEKEELFKLKISKSSDRRIEMYKIDFKKI